MKKLLITLCSIAAVLSGASLTTHAVSTYAAQTADQTVSQPRDSVLIYGTVAKTEDGRLHMIRQDGEMAGQDIILTISEKTKILDSVSGYPVPINSLAEGELVYAYIGPAVTLSLPPIGSAEMILCKIPEDYKVPEYITVERLTLNDDGVSGVIKSDGGTAYTVPSDCQILPYLTRNLITLRDLTEGRRCLIWTESDSDKAKKIVAFAPHYTADESGETVTRFGWGKENGSWYYYDQNGSMHKGWLLYQGEWYYLDPENGAMRTGFVTIDGKTYYLLEDGQMMTSPRSFTPDENGALH